MHEVAEAAYGDRAAATGFILTATQPAKSTICLWISQTSLVHDLGHVPERALRELTADRMRRFSVVTRHGSEALWAAEEAIMSGAVHHVIAEVEEADFTATRRLALASEKHGVPVTLLLPHRCEGATAAATRWRVSPRPSAPNRYDPHAPGASRCRAVLERCRIAPEEAGRVFDLEWNDETLSLGMVSGMVAGSATARPSRGNNSPPPQRKAG
ncbi:MAG: hypothetical protein R3C13_10695 [Hyphomonas sp.]|uniref:ImuA family protein n=1 Tax=Hyphomonas sp. TaxID=87 RepID=UPI00352968CD